MAYNITNNLKNQFEYNFVNNKNFPLNILINSFYHLI